MVSDVYAPLVGGQEREVQILSEGLRRDGHEVIVCTINHGFLPSISEENGVRIYRVKGLFQRIPKLYSSSERKVHPPLVDLMVAKAIKDIVEAESPEIIHSHGWMSYSTMFQQKRRKIPLCVSFHDYGFTCPCRVSSIFDGGICEHPLHSFSDCTKCMKLVYGSTKSLLSFLSLRIFRSFDCDGLISTNPNILEKMTQFRSKNYYLEHPIDIEKFQPTRTKDYTDRILVWAKLERIKGIDKVFQAAKKLRKYEFDIAFVGSDKEHYRAIKPSNVRLVPKIDARYAPEFINRYPMVLGQFTIGSLGLSELEAMSCGKPVIAYWDRKYDTLYNIPCPVMSARESHQIVDLINSNINNRCLGSLNRQFIVEHHSITRVVAKLGRIYANIIETKRNCC